MKLTSRMAVHLPTPLNGILTLWLPPTFAQKEENTLGWVLRQSDLTWEALVVSWRKGDAKGRTCYTSLRKTSSSRAPTQTPCPLCRNSINRSLRYRRTFGPM